MPSYKYDKNCNIYDTSKKQRTPSYTDRVLYTANYGNQKLKQTFDYGNEITCEYYNRCETTFSDHRPVLALFKAQVRKINRAEHKRLEEECLEKILSGKAEPLQEQGE